MTRPYVLLSVAVSVDGAIDDRSPARLLLSNAEDFERVDQVRAESDAIMIGAGTLRADNPTLLVNSEDRRAARVARGLPAYPLKVTVTATGDLDPNAKFWHHGGAKIVYSNDFGATKLRKELAGLAEVVSLGQSVDFGDLLDDLGSRGIHQLMIEGGGRIHTAFLCNGLFDELHLAIAPLLIGQAEAPRFLYPAPFPGAPNRRMRLVEVRDIGDIALLRYRPSEETTT